MLLSSSSSSSSFDALLRDQRLCVAGIAVLFGYFTFSFADTKKKQRPAAAVLDRLVVLLSVLMLLVAWQCVTNVRDVEATRLELRLEREGFEAAQREQERKYPWIAAAKIASPALQVCPDVLVRSASNGKFFLYNRAHPDFNPMVFRSLSEYMAHWREARRLGNPCPAAFLHHEDETNPAFREVQLEEELRRAEAMELMRDPTNPLGFFYPEETQVAREVDTRPDLDGGDSKPVAASPSGLLPLSALDNNQRQGRWTEANETRLRSMMGGYDVPSSSSSSSPTIVGAGVPGVSANPMDPNWGGPEYTRQLIDEGY